MSLVVVSTWSHRISRIVLFSVKTCFEQKSFVLCENGCDSDKKQEMRWPFEVFFRKHPDLADEMRKFSEKKDLPNSDIGRFFERKFRAARETLKIPKELPYFSESCTHPIPAPTHPFHVHLCVLRAYPK